MQVDEFPSPGVKIDAGFTTIQGGGPIPTAMVTLSRLGGKAAVIAAVGDDLFGRFVVAQLEKDRVDASYIIHKKMPTAVAAGWVEQRTGCRTIVLDLQIDIVPSDIRLSSLPKAKLIHIDGRYMPACMKLARWARRNNVGVVFDIGSMRNDVTDIIPLVDHLICAEDFALPYTGSRKVESAIRKLRKRCCGTILVTSGVRGALGYSAQAGLVRQRAFRVNAVDTTGAGDAYHGAYIFGLIRGWDLKKRMEFASALAAIKCTRPGGRTGIPSYNKVVSFLRGRPATYA
jgi:sulfofructose kinase